MGIFSEYLDRNLLPDQLAQERKKQLSRISNAREESDVLVYAADFNKARTGAPISIEYDDLVPLRDQLDNLRGRSLDFILETPGGSAEVAEDIVKLVRAKYERVSFVVPGMAKSAGTIMVMSGDEILMDGASSLGPIDAQIQWEGKVFSADALIKGLEKIKKEVIDTNSLNRAYIPILQKISPGEIQNAENALKFAIELVTAWLRDYKFKSWTSHSSTGAPVTAAERELRASEIAAFLCDHGRWLTHGRSIKLSDLERERLKITNFGKNSELSDAIRRYHALLQITFASGTYKIFETVRSQVYRMQAQQPVLLPGFPVGPGLAPGLSKNSEAMLQIKCPKCGKTHTVQADVGRKQELKPGAIRFPSNDILKCDNCGFELKIDQARKQIEMISKGKIIGEQ